MPATLQFLGAAGTVTGSMHLVTTGGHRFLLDCGLFQGLKTLRLRNWEERVPRSEHVHAVVLTHAHIDHSGYLPVLVRQGFRGPVYCTPATADLLGVVLPDSAWLQEEEAARANRRGYSKHHPAMPLYSRADAEHALDLLESRPFGASFTVSPGVTVTFRRAGHILGAATADVELPDGRLVYSGDLGRYGRPIVPDPEPVRLADVLLVEGTYGGRVHRPAPDEDLARIVRAAAARGGTIVVPAFAVDRTQELLWLLQHLEEERRIPILPVYVDSPMGIDVTEIYRRHAGDWTAVSGAAPAAGSRRLATRNFHVARLEEESRAINDVHGPAIIISSSGMATGGRILHHLSRRLPDSRTTILLGGFQAAGTRGRSLEDGAAEIKVFGTMVPVRARVEQIGALSAHADQDEILRWLGGFTRPPRRTYVVHAEPAQATALREAIRARYGWNVAIAADAVEVPLNDALGSPRPSHNPARTDGPGTGALTTR